MYTLPGRDTASQDDHGFARQPDGGPRFLATPRQAAQHVERYVVLWAGTGCPARVRVSTAQLSRSIRPGTCGITCTRGLSRRSVAVSYTHSEPTRLGMISYAVFCLKKK